MTGYTIGEYIRSRKLYLAAVDLNRGGKVIDVALDYGYETPASFAKAFKRFHGVAPPRIKRSQIKRFDPLTISIEIQEGERRNMDCEITDMFCVSAFHMKNISGLSWKRDPALFVPRIRVENTRKPSQIAHIFENGIVFNRENRIGRCDTNRKEEAAEMLF